MPDSAALVAESMAAAGIQTTGDMPDTTGDGGGDTGTVETSTPETSGDLSDAGGAEEKTQASQAISDIRPDTVRKPVEKAVEKAPEPDDLDKILSKYGITPPKQGKGSFTYDRFRKVLAERVKDISAKFDGDLKPLKERTGQIEAVERLIANDPMRYLTMLSQVYPQHYKRFLEPPAKPAEKVAEAPAFDITKDPMPQPDAKFPDGSPGYSPEGFQKYQEWNNRRLSAEIQSNLQKQFDQKLAQLDGRLKPYETRAMAAAAREREMPRVQATIAKLTERYGDLFVKDVGDTLKPNPDSILMKHMRENPGMHVFEAAADVYLPLMTKAHKEELDGQRESIHKELNGRPGAAASGGQGAGEKSEQPGKALSLQDTVRESMRRAGII